MKSIAAKLVHRKKLLGIDIGTRRIGLAISDGHHRMAIPYVAIPIGEQDSILDANLRRLFKSSCGLIAGDALGMDGKPSQQGKLNQRILSSFLRANSLEMLPVCFWDERYSSVIAEATDFMHRSIDAKAAAAILQEFLDYSFIHPLPPIPPTV